jgi:hypothetical protein
MPLITTFCLVELNMIGINHHIAEQVGSSRSARITLTISAGGGHTFGQWLVEAMPGPRFLVDALSLPNGYIVLLNGAAVRKLVVAVEKLL